jgi:hypothetical protein
VRITAARPRTAPSRISPVSGHQRRDGSGVED